MNVPYFEPWITTKDKKSVMKSLDSRWLTNGPFLKKFEKKVSTFLETKFAIGTSSATTSLHLSLRALGIKPGDEVIVPTNTFAATENAVLYCGATPVLTDVDMDTFNISITDTKKEIGLGDFYPNPTENLTRINYVADNNSYLQILDILGNKIQSFDLDNSGVLEIPTTNFSSGIYFGNLISDSKVVSVKKIVIN